MTTTRVKSNSETSPDAGSSAHQRREYGAYFTWAGGGKLASEVLRLAGTLFLTRLLNAEMFGLVLIVNRLIQGLTMVTDFGVNASIVQNRTGADPKFLNTAWTVQIARGILLWLVCWALASVAARFYSQPELSLLLPVAGFSLLFSGFNSPALGLIQRQLQLRIWVMIDVGAQLASVFAMVTVAVLTRSIWALIVGAIVAAAFKLVVSHLVKVGPRPQLGWDKPAFYSLITFGGWIIVNTFIGWLADSAEVLSLPHVVPIALVGVYGVASQLGSIPFRFLVAVGSNAVFPLFSRTQNAGEPLAPVYRMVQRGVLMVGGAAIALLLATGEAAIEALLDPRWRPAAPMLWPLLASQWFRILAIPGANAVFALGHPHWLVIGNTTKLLGYLLFVPLGLFLGELRGSVTIGVLWGFACGEAMSFISYRLGLMRFKIDVGYEDLRVCLRVAATFALLGGLSWAASEWQLSVIQQTLSNLALVAALWFYALKSIVSEVLLRRHNTDLS